MKKRGTTLIIVLSLGVLFVVARGRLAAQAAEQHETGLIPAPGVPCQVYLRGDAAGVSYHDRIADLGTLIVRKGTVARADDTWLVLRDNEHQHLLYIPRTSIMLIEAEK